MAANAENTWLSALERSSGIRQALIATGNVGDVGYCPDAQDYRPVPDVLVHALQRKGLDHVVLWDRFTGMQNVSDETRHALERDAASGASPCEQSHGEEYDVGDDDGVESGNGDGAQSDAQGHVPPNPDDFFAVVYHHMLHPNR